MWMAGGRVPGPSGMSLLLLRLGTAAAGLLGENYLYISIYIYINKIFSLLVLIGTTSYDVFFPLKKVL